MSRQMQADAPMGQLFYVSPTGNDGNAGTIGSPWLTLTHAQTAIRALVSGMHGPITVVIRGGTYALTSILAFTSADSGQNGYTVTWQAMPGEIVTISGGFPISTWTLHDSGKQIWQATVPSGSDFRQLYAGDTRVVRAVATASLSATVTGTGYSGTGGAYATYAIPTDLEFILGGTGGWRENRAAVTAITSTTITMASPVWSTLQNGGWPGTLLPNRVEGAYEILSSVAAPQTFYLNKSTNTVYYIPASGVDPNTLTITAPKLNTLITVTGATALVFAGLNLLHTSWLQAHTGEGYAENAGGLYVMSTGPSQGNVPDPALFLSGCTGVVIRNCAFSHLGGAGLWIVGGSTGCVLEGNIVADISAAGIYLSAPSEVGGTFTTTSRVENNVIHDVGVEYRSGVGLLNYYGGFHKIRHNRIYNCPYTALIGGEGDVTLGALATGAGHHEIAYNDLGPCMQALQDGGGIYINRCQDGTVVHHNLVHDVINGSPSAALYLDDASRGVTEHDNFLYNAAGWAILTNDTIGNNVITNTTGDNTVYHSNAGPSNGFGGASADSVAGVQSATTAAAQAWGVAAGAGLSPQFAYLTGIA